MKKNLLFLTGLIITILLQSNTFCQISLNANGIGNYFGAGTTWHQYSGSNVSMNIGIPSGTQAQTWTAPTFSATDSLTTNYILPASSPYSSYFQAATYTSKISSFQNGFALDSYQYINLSNDTLYIIGEVMHYYGSVGGHTVDTVLVKDTTYIVTILPIQIGASYSTMPDTISLGGGMKKINSNSFTTDAYGTLNLPNGSFQAVRLKGTYTTYVYNGASLINSYSSYDYTWLTLEGNQLKVDVDTSTATGNVTVQSIEITYVSSTATAVNIQSTSPKNFMLSQNYPNPFNPATTISFQIPKSSFVTLKVYDVLGREVASLINEQKSPGTYSVNFNASNLSSGMYLYRLQAGDFVETKKLVLLK